MFSKATVAFLNDLKANNSRDWFQAQKARYDHDVKTPAKMFAEQLQAALATRYGAEVRSKIFRINRDLRFSKDKTPYNTHIHMSFIDPTAGAAWMLGLETERLVIGFGEFGFDKDRLVRWRQAVDGAAGDELARHIADLTAKGCRIDEPELKRVPAPFDSAHKQAALLRRKGLAIWRDDLGQAAVFGAEAPAGIAATLGEFDPIRHWLTEHL